MAIAMRLIILELCFLVRFGLYDPPLFLYCIKWLVGFTCVIYVAQVNICLQFLLSSLHPPFYVCLLPQYV